MAGSIWEFFGYRSTDHSPEAAESVEKQLCPFIGDRCEKNLSDGLVAGVCSISPIRSKAVICCPNRLYAEDHRILKDVALDAFGQEYELVPGTRAVIEARVSGQRKVAVFGKRWGGELRIPKKDGNGGFWVDWVLALLDEQGTLLEFVAIEVQSIDTTGNYRNGREELLAGNRNLIKTSAGFNWENVNKRILPQLIYKGQLLQREGFCKKGLYFICPEQIFNEVIKRLGGIDSLPEYNNLQPASITFFAYDHDLTTEQVDGIITPLKQTSRRSTTVEMLTRAFNSVTLTEENVYRDAILNALKIEDSEN